MGSGRWSSNDYGDYSRTIAKSTAREIFRSSSIKKEMDPKGIKVRESRDSLENPNSTAIIVALDVTGSMGIIAEKMAKQGLGTLVQGIYDRKPVSDPHVMIMAVGDIFYDRAPLQATQFEADIRIAEQLQNIYLEGGGGGNGFESYDLPWYFAARKTSIDCFEKRGKKGYLFTVGDEPPPGDTASAKMLKEVLGGSEEAQLSSAQALAEAQAKYEVFHIIVEQGDYASRAKDRVTGAWREILGKRAIGLNNYDYMAEVILSVIAVAEGADADQVIASWEDLKIRKAVEYSLYGNK
jgi:hypothetical protein